MCPPPYQTRSLIRVLSLSDLHRKKYRFVILKHFPDYRLVKKVMG